MPGYVPRIVCSVAVAAVAWILVGTAWAQYCGDGNCDYTPPGIPPTNETPCNCLDDCPNSPPPTDGDGCCRSTTAGVDCMTDTDCVCLPGDASAGN